MTSEATSRFAGHNYLSLESFRKNGQGVATPVWFAEERGILYVYSEAASGKIKRIRNNPRVRVAPCDMRGGLRGDYIEAEARILEGDAARHADDLLNAKYGFQKRLLAFFAKFRPRPRAWLAIRVVYNGCAVDQAPKPGIQAAQPIEWTESGVVLLDQRLLPDREVRNTYTDYRQVARAIREMEIRGAPAIGVAAAMGVALGVERSPARTLEELRAEFDVICEAHAKTRPTAADLFWAIARMRRTFAAACNAAARAAAPAAALEGVRRAMVHEAQLVHQEKREHDESMGRYGAPLLPQRGRVMTQCNAGALATAGIGTALGVIRMAVHQGHELEVLVPETRPYLQGARLTAWELQQAGIPLLLITDNMVGHFLKTQGVGAIVVGADRVAANGDTANKIGTYQMAVLAREHGVAFYVAAPISTLDLSIPSGDAIPIEERSAKEVTHLRGVRIAPDVPAAHPAFDVTPASFITAIITERGVARAPYEESLEKLCRE